MTGSELYDLAVKEVPLPVYPTPAETIEDEIAAKRVEWQQFHAGTLAEIPSDPAARVQMHDEIDGELVDLIAENAQIIADNQAARDAVDTQYAADISSFMEVPANIEWAAWITIRKQRNALLAATDYTHAEDSPLTGQAKQAMRAHRQALRDIPQNYPTSSAALAALEELKSQ